MEIISILLNVATIICNIAIIIILLRRDTK